MPSESSPNLLLFIGEQANNGNTVIFLCVSMPQQGQAAD